jgi:hypothetical protein
MTLPPRLISLLEQCDFAVERLMNRMAGPEMTSGDGKMRIRTRIRPRSPRLPGGSATSARC